MSEFSGNTTRLSSRRDFLRTTGAAATVGSLGLAGCSAKPGLDKMRIAYMPIYPDMQYFIMQREGYFDQIETEVTAEQFPDGPSIVQAYATGKFEVAMFGIVPAMIVMDKGIPSQITAANIKNAMLIMASDEFADLWKQHGKQAFQKFEEQKGRKFKFGTFPPGSVPDILLRYWLENELGLDPETAVNIVPLGGAGPVRQALLAGEVDGTSIMEPVPTTIKAKDAPFQTIAWAGDFMPGQPAAVTLMHERLHHDHPKEAKQFVEQHIRATNFTENKPDVAAKHASAVIGKDVLPVDIAQKAMESRGSNFISNPREIQQGAEIFADYAKRLGKTEKKLSIEEMFNYDIYDQVTK